MDPFMRKRATKRWGIVLLALSAFVFFLPNILMVTGLERHLPLPPGDAYMSGLWVLYGCWTMGIGIAIVGLLCIVFLPFKAKPDRCEKCGYPYTGLTEPRCPECGTEFDPKKIVPVEHPQEPESQPPEEMRS